MNDLISSYVVLRYNFLDIVLLLYLKYVFVNYVKLVDDVRGIVDGVIR